MKRLAVFLGVVAMTILPCFANSSDDDQTNAKVHDVSDLMVATTPSLDGFKIRQYKGVVKATVVRQPTVGQGLSATVERLAGGKISAYANMCETAREQAYEQCLQRAKATGANALVGLQFDSLAIIHGDNVAAEATCYGTAVVVEPVPK